MQPARSSQSEPGMTAPACATGGQTSIRPHMRGANPSVPPAKGAPRGFRAVQARPGAPTGVLPVSCRAFAGGSQAVPGNRNPQLSTLTMSRRSLLPQLRARGVTAVLGPTNTGKTHLAIERMLGHDSGMIGLPLRLLAREVYQRVAERAGEEAVALVTGEEKIKPDNPRHCVGSSAAVSRH